MPYRQIVSRALKLGVNAFDTSPYYGPAEYLLGDALAAHAAVHGTARDSYTLITKAGRIGPKEFDYSQAHIRQSVLRSLSRLHTSYLDLVYLHDVEFVSADEVLDALQALRELQAEGLVHHVGISGFPVDLLCNLSELIFTKTGIPLDAVLSYGHCTIQNPQLILDESLEFENAAYQSPLYRFKKAGVRVVVNASMLGMGLLTQDGIPIEEGAESGSERGAIIAKWHPSPPALRAACQRIASIAEAEGYRLEDIALRWSMEAYAHAGALAGLGVDLPGAAGVQVGSNVMGVTTVAELEQTVELWNEILQTQRKGGSEMMAFSPSTTITVNEENVNRLVREKIWPALAEWKGYAWPSPGPGFRNERRSDTIGDVRAVQEAKL